MDPAADSPSTQHSPGPKGAPRTHLAHQNAFPYEPSLDGLRGVAIAGVVVYHACASSGLHHWVRGGFIGVSVFFTLSGFLITSLLLREHEQQGSIDVRRFWVRRIRRLSPAAAVVVAGVVALSTMHLLSARASDAVAAIWSATNWHVMLGGDAELLQSIVGPLGPTWSLAVEEQLYLLLVVAVLVTGRSRDPRRSLGAVAVVVVVTSIVLANTVSDWHPRLEFGTDLRAGEIAVGVALALLLSGPRAPAWSARTADVVGGLGLAALVICFLFVDYHPPWLLRGGYAVIALVTAITITGVLRHGLLDRMLSGRAIVGLGRISYSLYLVHWPVMMLLTRERLHLHGVRHAAAVIVVAVVVAVVLYVVVEQPIRRGRPTALRPTLVAHVLAATAISVVAWTTLP
jgi:peptidoglycan/LPS O-acetylase OafA/YrhL